MSGSKIRNIAIVSLLLINILFLVIIVSDAAVDARIERETLENVSAVLRAGGITISPDNIMPADVLRTMRTMRVDEVERLIAYTLLGEADITGQDGFYFYENPNRGTVEFYSAGDFDARLFYGVITSGGDAIGTVRSLLQDMGIETISIAVTYNFDDPEVADEVVTVVAAYRGAGVFNCVIAFEFNAESLVVVSGRYVAGVELMDDFAELSQVSSALLRFLSAVNGEELHNFDCDEILEVRAGYRHRVVGPMGEGVIDPVWLITTPNAAFMVDSDGEIWPMA